MPNIKGGKKHKRNKKQNNLGEKTLRLKDEGQEYAQIKKCNGNCRFDVLCFDGKERKAIMCGKMRKKKFVHANDIVLVSIREWQDSICDIIDNYDVNLARKLKDKGLVPKSINLDVDNQYSSDDDDNNLGIVFSTNLPDSSDDEKLEKVDSDEATTDEDIDVADI